MGCGQREGMILCEADSVLQGEGKIGGAKDKLCLTHVCSSESFKAIASGESALKKKNSEILFVT